jgi:hypothetical protein
MEGSGRNAELRIQIMKRERLQTPKMLDSRAASAYLALTELLPADCDFPITRFAYLYLTCPDGSTLDFG